MQNSHHFGKKLPKTTISSQRTRTKSLSTGKKSMPKSNLKNLYGEDSVESDPYSLRLSNQLFSSTKVLRHVPGTDPPKRSSQSSNNIKLPATRQLPLPVSQFANLFDSNAYLLSYPPSLVRVGLQRTSPRSLHSSKDSQFRRKDNSRFRIKQHRILVQRVPNLKIIPQRSKQEEDVVRTSIKLSEHRPEKKRFKKNKGFSRAKPEPLTKKVQPSQFYRMAQSLTEKQAKRLQKIFLIEYAAKNARLLKNTSMANPQSTF